MALLLGTMAFGLVARIVPQMNIFVVSMPVNIAVGLLFFGLSCRTWTTLQAVSPTWARSALRLLQGRA